MHPQLHSFLRNLRHLYEQMIKPGMIKDQKSAAQGLLSQAIALLEEIKDYPLDSTKSQD